MDDLVAHVRRAAVAYWRWNLANWLALRSLLTPQTAAGLLLVATLACVATSHPAAAWVSAGMSVALWAAVAVGG